MTAWPHDLVTSLIVTAPGQDLMGRRFGKNLRFACARIGISDAQIAKACGIGESSVLYYKRGTFRFPSTLHALKIATLLNWTMLEVFSVGAPAMPFEDGLRRRLEAIRALDVGSEALKGRYSRVLRERLGELGLRQSDVRRELMCNKTAVSFTYNGQRLPTQTFALQVSGLIGMGPLEMLTGINDMWALGRDPAEGEGRLSSPGVSPREVGRGDDDVAQDPPSAQGDVRAEARQGRTAAGEGALERRVHDERIYPMDCMYRAMGYAHAKAAEVADKVASDAQDLRDGRLDGQTMVEYALIAALIAVALIAVVQAMGGAVGEKFNLITKTLNNTTNSTVPAA